MQLKEALRQLDAENDDHWTEDGLPSEAAVSTIMGDPTSTEEIAAAAPKLTRDALRARIASSQPAPAPVAPQLNPTDYEELPLLEQPLAILVRDPVKCAAAIEEIEAESRKLLTTKTDVEKRLSNLFSLSSQLLRIVEMYRTQGQHGDKFRTDVANYLESQNNAREQRAARTRAFVEAGTSAKEVAEALRGQSRLDSVMSARKASLGSQRPTMVTKPVEE